MSDDLQQLTNLKLDVYRSPDAFLKKIRGLTYSDQQGAESRDRSVKPNNNYNLINYMLVPSLFTINVLFIVYRACCSLIGFLSIKAKNSDVRRQI